jgi:mono/diheme cytochrome c family protein/Tol biopolymer transport system component
VRGRFSFVLIAITLVLGVGYLGWVLGGPGPSGDAIDAAPAFAQTAVQGELRATLQLARLDTSAEQLELIFSDTSGSPLSPARVGVRASLTETDLPPTELVAERVADGRYIARGRLFALPGRYLIEATLERNDQPDLVAFAAAIGRPGEPLSPLLRDDEQALRVGQSLYAEHCAACHGDTGRGDGPNAVDNGELLPDMTVPLRDGLRSDGQLFSWSKNGISGTAMPGYGLVLRDNELWYVVAYLRSLAQQDLAGQPTRAPRPTPLPIAPVPDAAEPLPPSVFVRQGNLWRSDGAGNSIQLTQFDQLAFASDPALSPDGASIAFVVLRLPADSGDVSWQLHRMPTQGGTPEPIGQPSPDTLRTPTWLPDGSGWYVGVVGTQTTPDGAQTARYQIERIDQSGNRSVVVEGGSDPALSIDGASLAYVRIDPTSYEPQLVVAQPDGSAARELVGGPDWGILSVPQWSPDGSRIVFAASGGPPTDAQGLPVAQQPTPPKQTQPLLATHLLEWLGPAVAEAHGAPQDIWAITTDGSGLRRISTLYEDEPRAAWSPVGRELVWMGVSGIYRSNADGQNVRRIDQQGEHGGLVWLR